MAIVVSGASMSCALGADRGACFRALCAGTRGIGPLRGFEAERYAVQHAFEIDDRAGASDEPGRATRWLERALRDAVEDASLELSKLRVVVIVGTGLRELRSAELWWTGAATLQASQLHFGRAAGEALGRPLQCHTLSNACSSSNFALGLAQDLIELDEADAVIVAGVDSITESMFGLLDRVNPNKPVAIQPFDEDRRGTLMGEGAAAVVVESAELAQARGARVLAQLRGVGMGCDAHHETAPDSVGMLRAMRDAHARAGTQPAQVDLLFTHGTGTALNDEAEARASAELFRGRERELLTTAIKGMTGHTSGASGLMSVVTAIESLNQGIVPPAQGTERPIEAAAALGLVRGEARHEPALGLAQINAFGFGGVNAVVIVEAPSS